MINAYGRAGFIISQEVYDFLMLDEMAFCEENEVAVYSASNIHTTGVPTHTADMDYLALIAPSNALGEISIKPHEGDEYADHMYLSTPNRQQVSINPVLLFDGD